MIESYFVDIVPNRLYGVSKSNFVPGANALVAAAATEGAPPLTAPSSAVMPAF